MVDTVESSPAISMAARAMMATKDNQYFGFIETLSS